ncbi:nucleotidyltransferase domain-containing protein [Candidatus Pacearchaeota archaeon]|nr:nucleotidyltransferase domain-containing protein [Candidatus Pacearchaeota archaeon]
MKQELIKPIIKVGNSAGVLLPRDWLNGNAKIELIKKPLDLKGDILGIVGGYLSRIAGVYVAGSYARNEQEEGSDVDVLVITENVNKKIKKGKYDITYISKGEVERQLSENALPILPMIKEAQAIINGDLIKEYAKWNLNKKNLKWHIKTTKSAMKIVEKFIELEEDKKTGRHKISDNIAYSLILRLREVHIVDCMAKNKIPATKELLKLIVRLSGDKEAYYAYKRSKEKSSGLKRISTEQARKIYSYVNKKIKEQEEWLKAKSEESR